MGLLDTKECSLNGWKVRERLSGILALSMQNWDWKRKEYGDLPTSLLYSAEQHFSVERTAISKEVSHLGSGLNTKACYFINRHICTEREALKCSQQGHAF